MTFQYDGYNYLVRLEKGEKLIESLTALVKKEKIPSCWINAVGAVSSAQLGFYHLDKKEYEWHLFYELMEITGLQGNITFNAKEPVFHIHGTFSKQDMSAIGGHVKELTIAGTCEILLHRWYGKELTRTKSEEIGLNLLDL
jgi:uncharacterized protein